MARSLAEGDLKAGRLVSPFDLTCAEGYGYYLVYEAETLKRPKCAAFRAFVRQEAARASA
jgi:LysR family glycine cleavage system transcriptional activator